jgi:hypothetical protein
VKNGEARKKSSTSGADKEVKEIFLDTVFGKINEMFPVPIEREFRIVFCLYSYFPVYELYSKFTDKASGKSVYLLELHVVTTINMFSKVCCSVFSVAAGPQVPIVTVIF